ncbi:hypothetical protein [Propionicicella superfundia]|uniref:hypothetical protein n=1 Tax=Propionicicella superfundia TaxID=348582 RepID=UPI000560BF74|nr:hypothetical protein [Propionicicella superfundia]
MSRDISFDPGATRSVGASVDELAQAAAESVAAFRNGLAAAGVCWGSDRYGAAFGAAYLTSAQDAAIGAVEHANQLAHAGADLLATAAAQEILEQSEIEAARDIG